MTRQGCYQHHTLLIPQWDWTVHYCDSQMLQESSVLPPWVAFSLGKDYTKKTLTSFCSGAEVICSARVCNLNKSKASISGEVDTR